MSEKRNDLQGVRGVAILLVLVFHLKPNLFPYGFIGVDMFFVLSGYLMTMILSKKLMNSNVLLEFYLRRFKRIVPLFYFILTAVYIVSWFYLIEVDRLQLLTDIKWSLSFTSNIQPLFEISGYWDQVVSYRFLVHCWSLGVEIQFYLMAPFIIGYCRQQKWNYLVYILLLLSLLFQLISPPKIAYGIIFSRIWQFLCGTVAYEIEQKTNLSSEYRQLPDDEMALMEEEENDVKLTKSQPIDNSLLSITIIRELLLISLVFLVLVNPPSVGETAIRLVGTLLTAAYICSSNLAGFSFASTKLFVYIGDISYTLYLVHWPTIVFYKYYYSLTDLSVTDIMWCISAMFVISIIIHHTLEVYLIANRLLHAFLLFFGCFVFIVLTASFYGKDIEFAVTGNDTNITTDITSQAEIIENAIRINNEEDKRGLNEDPQTLKNGTKNYRWVPCHRDFEAEKWTKWTSEVQLRCVTEGNGSLNVLVMGNSIAYRAFPTIHEMFKGRFKTMRLFSASGRAAIYSKSSTFSTYEKAIRTIVERSKPDIIFIIFTTSVRIEGYEMMTPVKDWKTDKVMQHMQKNFDFYSKYSRKIVVELPYYININLRFAQEINKRLKLRKPLDDLKVTRKEVYDQRHWQHERLRRLNCSKCIYNDIGESLFDGDTFYFYDRKTYLAILSDGAHFSQAGLKRTRKQYGEVVEKVIAELN